MMRPNNRNLKLSFLILFLSFAGIGILFLFTYHYDNKYTMKDTSIQVLTDGWEFYPGASLDDTGLNSSAGSDPEFLSAPYELVTIGSFGNFSGYTRDHSPFGRAVYRKELCLEPLSGSWLMELPEIFSACNVYINGERIHTYGSVSGHQYQIHTQNTLVPLPDGDVEIVIEASNYSHYYSGLVYPPMIGEAGTITHIVICRLIFYAFLCFFTLGCAVVSFTVWFRRQTDSLYASYGVLCLCFAVHISYPLLHWIGINAGVLPYVIEDTAYFAVLVCMTVLTYRLTQTAWPRGIYIACYVFSISMAAFPLLSFYLLFPVFPQFVSVYGHIIALSKVIMSIYLILAAFGGARKNPRQSWLLAGNVIFGFGILIDYLTAGRFEPARFGWQTEYCCFIMVLLFTVLISDYNHKALTQRQYLMEHLKDEVDLKTAHLTSMLEERRQFLSAVAHDLKAPVAAINTYIDYIRSNGIGSDEELRYYLDVIDHKSSQIQDNVQSLQLFHTDVSHKEPPAPFDILAFLGYVYRETCPYTDAGGIYYRLKLPQTQESSPVMVYGQKESLFRAFENLVINATEHTPAEGTLVVSAAAGKETVEITFRDSGDGILPEHLERIFDYEFSTKTNQGLSGLGLYFTRISIEEFGGSITAESDPGCFTAFHIRLPVYYPDCLPPG